MQHLNGLYDRLKVAISGRVIPLFALISSATPLLRISPGELILGSNRDRLGEYRRQIGYTSPRVFFWFAWG